MQRCGSEEMVELANLWPAFIIYHSSFHLPPRKNKSHLNCGSLSQNYLSQSAFCTLFVIPGRASSAWAHALLCWLWSSWPLARVWPGSYNIKWLLGFLFDFIRAFIWIVSNLVLALLQFSAGFFLLLFTLKSYQTAALEPPSGETVEED